MNQFTVMDQFVMALTAWRENRGGGQIGMQSVINVVMNRAKARLTSPYAECIRPWQFSSVTAKGDPQLAVWPAISDSAWQMADELVAKAISGNLPDITDGATSYYALSMTDPPSWAGAMTPTVEIAGQKFFRS